MRENKIQRDIRLALGADPRRGVFYRNAVGVAVHPGTGHTVRYGLCPGSSDLIGFTVVQISPAHIGTAFARFTALEVKTDTGRTSPGQRLFLDLVRMRGGFGAVVRSPEDALAALERARLGETE